MPRFPQRPCPVRLRAGLRAAVVVVAATLAVGACTNDIQARGNMPNAQVLEQLRPGETSRAEVAQLLGTPSTTSMFDGGETWFYIGGKQRQVAFYRPEELERLVLAIRFDETGTIDSLRSLDKEDGTTIAVVDRTTPTAGQELTILEQLLGNIGRFNAEPSGNLPTGGTVPGR